MSSLASQNMFHPQTNTLLNDIPRSAGASNTSNYFVSAPVDTKNISSPAMHWVETFLDALKSQMSPTQKTDLFDSCHQKMHALANRRLCSFAPCSNSSAWTQRGTVQMTSAAPGCWKSNQPDSFSIGQKCHLLNLSGNHYQ